MSLIVKDVYDWINEVAPFETAESYDNVGLLIGSMGSEISKILIALDATPAVVDEALKLNAELIITHHPLMFRGTKKILEEYPDVKTIELHKLDNLSDEERSEEKDYLSIMEDNLELIKKELYQ